MFKLISSALVIGPLALLPFPQLWLDHTALFLSSKANLDFLRLSLKLKLLTLRGSFKGQTSRASKVGTGLNFDNNGMLVEQILDLGAQFVTVGPVCLFQKPSKMKDENILDYREKKVRFRHSNRSVGLNHAKAHLHLLKKQTLEQVFLDVCVPRELLKLQPELIERDFKQIYEKSSSFAKHIIFNLSGQFYDQGTRLTTNPQHLLNFLSTLHPRPSSLYLRLPFTKACPLIQQIADSPLLDGVFLQVQECNLKQLQQTVNLLRGKGKKVGLGELQDREAAKMKADFIESKNFLFQGPKAFIN